MKACGCSNENFDLGKFDSSCEADFDIESIMKESLSSNCGFMGSNSGESTGLMPVSNQGSAVANGSGMIGLPGCGKVRNFNRSANVQGKNFQIVNRNYYNNYYSRYNHYFVTDLNIVRSFVKDYNVYHYYTRTVNEGCKYLGSSTIIANGGNGFGGNGGFNGVNSGMGSTGWGSGCGSFGNNGCGCY